MRPDHETAPDWLALFAAAATAAVHFAVGSGRPLSFVFIAAACLFWAVFIAVRARQNKNALRAWGFRADNLAQAAALPAAIFVLAATGFAVYAGRCGTFRWPSHWLLLFLVYPVWGVIQQFLMLGVVVSNLERIRGLGRHKTLIVVPAAALFGLLHVYDSRLAVATFLLELVIIPLYMRQRNLWPLGALHGWLGALFYLWVLNRDLLSEVFWAAFSGSRDPP
jgi:hypothetical protein